MNKTTKEAIREVAKRTGLREHTVLDLLHSGWQYTETLNQMPRWQRPELVMPNVKG